MPEQEEIDQQIQLLNIPRRTLAALLQRLARIGGLAYAPPEVVNGIAEAPDEGDLEFIAHGQSSVLAAIATSVDILPAEQAARYRELAIFPQDEPLAEAAVARLWAQTASLKPRHARRLLADLRDRALVQADNTLHDLQYDYLRAQVPPAERQRLHGALADATSNPATGTPSPDDTHGWRRLAYHLARAERNDDLHMLNEAKNLCARRRGSGTSFSMTMHQIDPTVV